MVEEGDKGVVELEEVAAGTEDWDDPGVPAALVVGPLGVDDGPDDEADEDSWIW